MRSLFLFVCCIVFMGAAVYLALQIFLKPVDITSTAHAAVKPAVFIASVEKRVLKGAIIRARDLSWIPYRYTDDISEFMTRAAFSRINQLSFSIRQNAEPGAILKKKDFLWPEDKDYLSNILRTGFRAVEVKLREGLLEKKSLTIGSNIDLLLSLNGTLVSSPRPDNRRTLVTVKNLRVLDERSIEKGKRNVILEVTETQAEVILLSQEMGRLSLLLRSKEDSKPDPGYASMIRKQLLAMQKPTTGQLEGDIERSLVIQRGAQAVVLNRSKSRPGRSQAIVVSHSLNKRGQK